MNGSYPCTVLVMNQWINSRRILKGKDRNCLSNFPNNFEWRCRKSIPSSHWHDSRCRTLPGSIECISTFERHRTPTCERSCACCLGCRPAANPCCPCCGNNPRRCADADFRRSRQDHQVSDRDGRAESYRFADGQDKWPRYQWYSRR